MTAPPGQGWQQMVVDQRLAMIADGKSPEARALALLLRELAPDQAPCRASSIHDVLSQSRNGRHFDVIIVAQSWPGQYAGPDVLALIGAAPLARLVCCYGPWCDSDGRRGSCWPAGCRVPLGNARARLERELAAARRAAAPQAPRGDPPARLLPLTASGQETFDYDFANQPPRVSGRPEITVDSPDAAWRRMIERALLGAGFERARDQAPAAVIFDADPCTETRLADLAGCARRHPRSAIIACLGFPRVEVEDLLLQRGAAACWFKLATHGSLVQLVAASLGGANALRIHALP